MRFWGDRTFKLASSTTSEYGRYVKSLGEPRDGQSSGEEALAAAAGCEPVLPELDSPSGTTFSIGEEVTVSPTDYGCIPVAGRLVAMSSDEVVIERSSDETGAVFVHFPQAGVLVGQS